MSWATAGPYIASGVALIVGIWNPSRSNKAAERRQREQLADTAQRQREQLDHDRAMRRRDEIIGLLGDATKAGAKRFSVANRAQDLWMRDLAWHDSRTQGLEAERVTVIEELRDAWGRMEIRFSRDSDVRQRFNTWSEALDDYSQALRFGHAGKRPYVPEMVKVVELQDSARKAADRWLEAARAAVAELE